ncbi:MAG: hypothetical protein IPJ36_13615 [Simplicispira sp.]|nr:hypothetical protein [Simplicispira sp.]
MLQNFEVLAVLESPVEPWFVGARVATTVTIARRCDSAAKREVNTVRFVQLRKPLSELLEHDDTTLGAVLAADALRDEILQIAEDVTHSRYRARLVNQGLLWQDGVELGRIMRGEDAAAEEANSEATSDDVSDTPRRRTITTEASGVSISGRQIFGLSHEPVFSEVPPAWKLVEIRFGVKSGKDDFFYPKDSTADCLTAFADPIGFEHEYGVSRAQVENGNVKLVLAGEKRGELHAIESEYLEPEVHSLMEVKGFIARAGDCSRLIFLAPSPKSSLKKWAKAYVKWGEERSVHLGSTCAQRVTKEKEWFDLTGHRRGVAFWPKAQQYKHAIPLNSDNLQANCNLYDLFPEEGVSGKALAALLNSTLAILAKHQFGRPVGVEGNLKTEIVDVSMMLVPDLRLATRKTILALEAAMDVLAEREPKQLLSERRLRTMAFEKSGKHAELELLSDDCELDMPDRRALDHTVLELLGVKNQERARRMDQPAVRLLAPVL